MTEIYDDDILDHYQNPRHWGVISRPTFSHVGYNPLCGDTIRITGIKKKGIIEKVAFTAQGCVISISAASILLERIYNQKQTFVQRMNAQDMLFLLEVHLSPMRVQCGLLAWDTLREALNNAKK